MYEMLIYPYLEKHIASTQKKTPCIPPLMYISLLPVDNSVATIQPQLPCFSHP